MRDQAELAPGDEVAFSNKNAEQRTLTTFGLRTGTAAGPIIKHEPVVKPEPVLKPEPAGASPVTHAGSSGRRLPASLSAPPVQPATAAAAATATASPAIAAPRASLKALTIKQPFASGILAGVKKVENRSWGGPGTMKPLPLPSDGSGLWLVLHSSSKPEQAGDDNVRRLREAWPTMPPIDTLPTGEILGCFHVSKVVPAAQVGGDPQAVGPLCWMIDDVVSLAKPDRVKWSGSLGLWKPPDTLRLPPRVLAPAAPAAAAAAPARPQGAGGGSQSQRAALESDSARHVFKAGPSHVSGGGGADGAGGGGGGGGGGGASRTLGEIMHQEASASSGKRRKPSEPAAPPPEKRYDSDRRLYTRDEFVEFYGGDAEWEAAPRKAPRKAATSAAEAVGAEAAAPETWPVARRGGAQAGSSGGEQAGGGASSDPASAAEAARRRRRGTSTSECWWTPPDPDVMDLLVCAAGGWKTSLRLAALNGAWRVGVRAWIDGATSAQFNGCSRLNDATVGRTIARAPRLQTCELASCGSLTDGAAAAIARGCPLLTAFLAPTCRGLTDATLVALARGCPRLTALDLSHCRTVGATMSSMTSAADDDEEESWCGLGALARGCAALESLKLNGCKHVRDAAVQAVAAGCARLRELELDECGELSDAALEAVAANCRQLTTLRVAGSKRLSADGLLALGGGCAELRVLSVGGCARLGGGAFAGLAARCPKLARLYASRTGLDDAGASAIARGCGGALEQLYLGHTSVGDATVAAIRASCPRLVHLELAGTQVTDTAVKSLADALDPDEPAEAEGRLPKLALLDLSHNQLVTRAEAASLQRRCGKAVRVDAARLRD